MHTLWHAARQEFARDLREPPPMPLFHAVGHLIEQSVGSPPAARKARLDWSVEARGLYTTDLQPIPRVRAIISLDPSMFVCTSSSRGPLRQPADLFAAIDHLTRLPLVYECGGLLRHGAAIWVIVHATDLDLAIGNDLTRCYLLFVYEFECARAVMWPITVRMASGTWLRTTGDTFESMSRRIGRLRGIPVLLGARCSQRTVLAAYSAARHDLEATRVALISLARAPFTQRLIEIVQRRYPVAVLAASGEQVSQKAVRDWTHQLERLLERPWFGVAGTRRSAFALLHAIAYLADHGAADRDGGSVQRRLDSSVFSTGAAIKRVAWQALSELAAG